MLLVGVGAARAADWSNATLFNGERTGVTGTNQFLNNWGGTFGPGNISSIVRDTSVSHSGAASIRANLSGVNVGQIGFFQTFASQQTSFATFRQTRDLTRYDSLAGYVRNTTAADLTLRLEIKDYRDDNANRASYSKTIPKGGAWTPIAAPLDINSPDWVVDGSPDLSRTYITSFVFSPQDATATGSVYVDDFSLHEAQGALDTQTAPINQLAERLAERQFSGLWTARNRTTGLIYNSSDVVDRAALNTTAGVLWMLPSAVKHGWVAQSDADAMAGQVANSLNTNLNQQSFPGEPRYVPTRFLNSATAARFDATAEESSIDASFILLALQGYKAQPTTSPALAASLDAVANRFRLDAFTNSVGFRMAYTPSGGFTSGYYDGYTNEGKTISLAAESSDAHHVPLESRWNADTARSRVFLVNSQDAHLAHSLSQYRAPFEQALLNLFVDTSDRGVDNYPNRSLATNPWENYVRYEREVSAKLDQLGRDNLFQPDAANGGSPDGYQQYSPYYKNFVQQDLFMPWSVSLALLAGAPGSEDALRALMSEDLLNGPLGLADSARWVTGAAGPTNVPAGQDNWNMALSTMALLEYLDGDESASHFFANLPNIDAALDRVFHDGDVDGNGVSNALDLAKIQAGFGILAGATPATGDADGDGAVDGADLLRWQRGFAQSGFRAVSASVPEPATVSLSLFAACLALAVLKRTDNAKRVGNGVQREVIRDIPQRGG